VASDQVQLAEDTLIGIGFGKVLDSTDQPAHACHSHVWRRPSEGTEVDLHWSLDGVEASSEELWRELSTRSERIWVAGAEIDGLGTAARTFHTALHAAQHGPHNPKSLEDLRRALAQCNEETWVEAAEMAERLQASSAFGTGLRMLSAGSQLAGRLGVPENSSVIVALRADARPQAMTLGMHHLAETKGARGRLKVLWSALWPSAQFMRACFPLARKGRVGLGLARLWRPVWLVLHAPRAFASVRAARRQLDGPT